ncbi:uncharacterized protein DSM5745_08187 [Aspergillus mulundensis]|uniref:Uncharacterized protein n=1 Tax=Aspergillus mulundensis TaxID=1810919 RepID=A0A3D8R9M0_9EURO|nr:hypothetical protein DSM5745_08187 [Aspergillus mulundensis]RDW70676.1 hypothetical protein DSM5745_08187 [Aspergillus mulundensis]
MCFSDRSQKKSETPLAPAPAPAPTPVPVPVPVPTPTKQVPVAYRIDRGRDEFDPSPYHIRTRSSIQRHLDASPPPTEKSQRKNNKRFPKKYRDDGQINPKLFKQGSYYEYPTMSWPYNSQNAKGQGYRMVNGVRDEVEVGFTRTITDRNKNIQGVIYHPKWSRRGFVRAETMYSAGAV